MKALSDIKEFEKIYSGETVFARAAGCPAGLADTVAGLDRALSGSSGCAYKRITSFPQLADGELISRYTALYEKFASGERKLLTGIPDESNTAFCAACEKVCERVKKEMPSMTDGIKKNLVVSMLFWGDRILPGLEKSGKKGKFICSGKLGYREYAFCMALAERGIDVLMLLPEGDISLSGKLGQYSCLINMGAAGKLNLPEPVCSRTPVNIVRADRRTVAQMNAEKNKAAQPAGSARPSVDISRPDRPAPMRQDTGKNPSADSGKELEYEQLAELASSVVMIAVCDEDDEVIGSGSGISINDSGYILTNFHVIRDGRIFAVRIENDDSVYRTCDVVKYHPEYDLAIIRIGASIKPLEIYGGSVPLKRGQKVVAIGSPMGLFNSVSDGIIAGFRDIRGNEMIQFTAPISGGSSGGAILNMQGQVIGISTAGIEGGQNLNLAVSFKEIRAFAGNFLKK